MLSIGFFSACNPEKPEDEKENKLHEDPTQSVFTLTEGKLRSGAAFENMPQEADFVPTGNVQKIVWEVVKGENFKTGDGGQTKFVVKNTKKHPDVFIPCVWTTTMQKEGI